MKFNEFREVDIGNQRSGIGYCFFFLFQKDRLSAVVKGYFIMRGDGYDSNYAHRLGCA
ncbi:hypothetical protein [Peribacillus muralis]|uniref:hypothetical protein n=1 Tax=Peribacillus muralis TaxID=264697 RepID=UPI003D046061